MAESPSLCQLAGPLLGSVSSAVTFTPPAPVIRSPPGLVAAQPWQPIAKWDLWCLTCCFMAELKGIDIDAKPEGQAARHAMIHLDGLHERIFDLRGWLRKRSRCTSG